MSWPESISGSVSTKLDPIELLNMLAAPFKRATGTKHYRRVGVVTIGWDFDGVDNNFTALATELTDLLRDVYNYETFHITLPSGKDNTRSKPAGRDAAAVVHLVDRLEEITVQFNHEDCALIIAYRGHSVPVHVGTLNSGRSDTAQHDYGTHPNGSRDGMELFLAYFLSLPPQSSSSTVPNTESFLSFQIRQISRPVLDPQLHDRAYIRR